MVAIYFPTLKYLLISILAFLPLWTFQMSIHIIDMSDLGKTLITLGLDTKEMVKYLILLENRFNIVRCESLLRVGMRVEWDTCNLEV